MNAIEMLDLLAIFSYATCLVFLMFYARNMKWKELRLLFMGILFLSMMYGLFEYAEWSGRTTQFEPYENFVGALIPMMWGYLFYNIIQLASSAELKESERRLDLALKGTRAGLWDWDVQSGRHVVSERWAEIIGYTLKELEPLSIKTLEDHTHPVDLRKGALSVQKHFNGETSFYECEMRMKHKQGHWVWVLSSGMVVERDVLGNPLRMAGTHIDISRQKRAEEALKRQMDENLAINEKYQDQNRRLELSLARIREINEQLFIAKEKAEESDRLKSAFLSNMSHEIRTPMNGILGFATMLKKAELSNKNRIYYAGIILNSGNQLLTIVNDILDISRIETGRVDIMEEEVDLALLVEDVRTFFAPLAAERKLALLTFKDSAISGSSVLTDRVRLRQVLSNLVHNAIKFTEEGSIEFGFRQEAEQVEFFVRDTGVGIPKDKQEVIFKPFRQLELEITRVPGGTGLGLSISKGLVKLLGGRIWVESKPGEGTVFYFTLPWKTAHLQAAVDDENLFVDFSTTPKHKVILLAEDDEVSSQYVQEALSQLEPHFVLVDNGLEAVEYCRNNAGVDLVLMDIKMPLMNGYQATRQIRELRPGLPVIAITAFAKEEDRLEAMDAGCVDFLPKPVRAKDLLISVTRHVNGTKRITS